MFRPPAILIFITIVSCTAQAGEPLVRAQCPCEDLTAGRMAFLGRRPVLSIDTRFVWSPQAEERAWRYIVIHHSATSSGSVESIHNDHRQRKDSAGNNWLGIGYHFVVGNGSGMGNGEVEPTFRWSQQIHGAHSGSLVHNSRGIGICVIGDFQQQKPSEQQVRAVTSLIRQLAGRYRISPDSVIGHNVVKATACPGRHFPLDDIVLEAINEPRSES